MTLANAAANGVQIAARIADALTGELPRTELAVANVALDVVEALLPRLPARRAVVSGYLVRDRPTAAGWSAVDRRAAGGWAADLLERV